MRSRTPNPQLLETIRFLKVKARENKAGVWATAAEQLSRSRRSRASLNVNHIARAATKNSLVLVPGKVLGSGVIKYPVTVGALAFSTEARSKIEQAGGQCVRIEDLVTKYPNGSNVLLLR